MVSTGTGSVPNFAKIWSTGTKMNGWPHTEGAFVKVCLPLRKERDHVLLHHVFHVSMSVAQVWPSQTRSATRSPLPTLPDVPTDISCCGLFQNGSRISERRQYSGSLLRDKGVTSVEVTGRGPPSDLREVRGPAINALHQFQGFLNWKITFCTITSECHSCFGNYCDLIYDRLHLKMAIIVETCSN